MLSSENNSVENRDHRRAMRDLVALSTLPAIWIGSDPDAIARSLADVLLDTLALDLVCVRLTGAADGDTIEVIRGNYANDRIAVLRSSLASLTNTGPMPLPVMIPDPLGEGTIHVAVTDLGLGGDCGVVVAGSRRPDFPTEQERLLLSVGANQTAIVMQRWRAEQALKDADRRKDEFLATLAHELRNPLAPIRNAVHILRARGSPVPELQWARDVIERQVEIMTRLVDDLLDVSRITTGKIELRKERIEVATVVNSAVEASRPLIEKCGHELAVTLPPEPAYLEADRTRLAQVLLNLLNNAAKYTERGGRIWLTAEQDGERLVVRVRDTGIGIAPEMLPHIFEMFTQVDRSVERSQGGLGIGLTLVRSLAEMHGGTIEVHSDGPGKGSEFVVRLPLAMGAQDRGGAGGAREKTVAPAKCRILVVDDNEDSADSLAMLLRMMGNEVHTAHDGLEAVGAAGEFRPNLVLLDIGLPKLDGHEAGRRIRNQQGKDVVLVALTGWGQEEDRRRSKEAGFDYHMTKPIGFDALQELLVGRQMGRPSQIVVRE